MNISVVDIGSNSLRMQISRISKGFFEVIEEVKEMLRLGDDVFVKGCISDDLINKLVGILKEISVICDSKSVEHTRVVATASFREASNVDKVIKIIRQETGYNVEVIDGEYEAYLGFLGVSANFDISNSKVLITDIGGGSSEFVISDNKSIKMLKSTPYGCNKLFHEYFKHDKPLESEIVKFKDDIALGIESLGLDRTIEHVICLGGTANNISFIKDKSPQRVKYTDRKFLKNFIREISNKTTQERKKIKNLEQNRADIILPAALFIDKILDITGRSGFYTLSGGLRSGLTIDTINKLGIVLDFQKKKSELRLLRIMEIGKKFNFESHHAINVRNLSLSIFDKTEKLHKLSLKHREILEAAAILHDIGNYISYSKHHKHSYYLIKNSDFIGYSFKDVEIIANVARYHRKSIPKDTHSNFMCLSEEDKIVVKKLAAILRIADAFDRTHTGRVVLQNVDILEGSVLFRLNCNDNTVSEVRAFEKKKDLFEKIFTVKAVIV